MGTITAIFNQKGGVGKTTTAINLGAGIARLNKKTIIVDMDSQGNATSGVGIDKNSIDHDIFGVLAGEYSAQDAIVQTSSKNLDLICGSIDMASLEVELAQTENWPILLKNSLDQIKDLYDHIIVDCPPSLGLNSLMSLVAADHVLITIQTEFYALEGTVQLMDTVSMVRDNYNQDLDIIGVLLVMYDGRTRLSQDVEDEVRDTFEDLVFDTKIFRNVRLAEAPSYGQTIYEYDNLSRGSWNYKALTKEFLKRTDQHGS